MNETQKKIKKQQISLNQIKHFNYYYFLCFSLSFIYLKNLFTKKIQIINCRKKKEIVGIEKNLLKTFGSFNNFVIIT